MRSNLCLSTLAIALLVSPFASAVHLWGSSATDHLVSLQAMAFIKEVPGKINAINDSEQKAKDDKAAASKVEHEKLVKAHAATLENLENLEAAIAAETAPAKREAEAQIGRKRAEYEALLEKQDKDAAALRKAEEDLEAEPNILMPWNKTGITQEKVDALEKELANTRKAVEALGIDLAKTIALQPSEELSVRVVQAQSALIGITVQLERLKNSVALPEETTRRYQEQRDAWKKAAVCMVKATHCTNAKKKPLEVASYDAIASLSVDLTRCATDTLGKASKAVKSDSAEKCHGITVDSSTTDIQECVVDYRAKVLGKPDTANSYKDYDPCAGLAPVGL